jgi:O-antigen ligase
MNPSIALLICMAGIGGLFFLDREKSARISKAVWLPVIWLWINGSRPVSEWFGMRLSHDSLSDLPATSMLDQSIAAALMILGIIVIVPRRKEVMALLKGSWPIILYFSFCLVSLLWSDFPAWGLKRWLRALGDLVMVLIVLTEAQPMAALRRFFSRVGFVLLPISLLLIKYFPELGQNYGWGEGKQRNTGVTTNKNALGVLAYVVTLGTLWQVFQLLLDKKQPNRGRRLLAQCTLLCFGVGLLVMAHSATSWVSCAIGAALMVFTSLPPIRHRPAVVHTLVLGVFLIGGLSELLGARGEVMKAIGRQPDFTGRTPVWKALIAVAPDPMIGAGFETFWIGQRVAELNAEFRNINEAHNGYLEVYLNLGWFGVGLIALIIGQGYRRAVIAFRNGRDPTFGSLLLAYIVTAVTYSISEAGFRMLTPSCLFLLLAVVATGRITNAGRSPAKSRRELAIQPSSWTAAKPV